MHVLVTWVSPHGSTAEIAQHIGRRLREDGHDVDCRPVGERPDPAGYDAVLVGSAIHDQAWLPEAARFLTEHGEDLATRPVWLFSVGMPGALARPLRRSAMREGPAVVAPFEAAVHPRGTRLFTGVIRKEHFPPGSSLALRLAGVRFGDHRDWPAIEAWTDDVSRSLRELDTAGQ